MIDCIQSRNMMMSVTMDIKNKTQYLMGDKIRFTGNSEILHGALFYEAHWIEGHRKGIRCDVHECNIYILKSKNSKQGR
jgi:hypothetical protein